MSEPEQCGPVRPPTESVRRGRKSKAEEEVQSFLEFQGLPVSMCGTCGHVAGTNEDCEGWRLMNIVNSEEFKAWVETWRSRHPQDICPDLEKLFYQFSAERVLLESGYRDASESWPLLYSAVRLLDGHCDGAVMPDFRCRWWTQKMADEIYLRIRKYRMQLARAGVDCDTIPRPERVV